MSTKQLSFWKCSKSDAGKMGYFATINKMGKEEFHRAGGAETARLDLWHCPCHGVGIAARSYHLPLKGKKHRYGGY